MGIRWGIILWWEHGAFIRRGMLVEIFMADEMKNRVSIIHESAWQSFKNKLNDAAP